MTTAVDANVLLDILAGSNEEATLAEEALRKAALSGELVLSAICYAEVAGRFSSQGRADAFLNGLGCEIHPVDQQIAFLASQYFRSYRRRGGDRTRILPDFLIAAHAQLRADRLLSRDKRFFGTSFPKLKTISPVEMAR
ncbi:MAG: PIN domain-containing protein [Acidobacteria bacterium]|nr:PIN domain-containing protein [Acidobacteriota bacterium]